MSPLSERERARRHAKRELLRLQRKEATLERARLAVRTLEAVVEAMRDRYESALERAHELEMRESPDTDPPPRAA